MATENTTLQVPKDVIDAIVKAEINSKVVAAIGQDNIMRSAINTVFNAKVDQNGSIHSYNSNNTTPWIDWAIGNALREAVKAAIVETLAEQKEAMKKHLAAELSKKNSPLAKNIADTLINGFVDGSRLQYSLAVTVSNR